MSRLRALIGFGDERLDAYERQLEEHVARIDKQQRLLERQRQRVREVLAAQETMTADIERINVVVPVLQQQLSSLESRLQQLLDAAQGKAGMLPATAEDTRTAEAKLLEDLRREHRLVRARFGAISRYEERMRRLEAAIEPLPESGSEASTDPQLRSPTD